jgi:hypothetical protein
MSANHNDNSDVPSARDAELIRRRRTSRKALLLLAALYLALAFLIVFVGRGTFFAKLLGLAVSLYIGIPVFLASSVLALLARAEHRTTLFVRATRGFAVSLILLALTVPVKLSDLVRRHDRQAAQGFCELLAARADSIHASGRSYPTTVTELTQSEPLPRLLHGRQFYASAGTNFTLIVVDAGSASGGWSYTSEQRAWKRWD